jgi:putative heme-binding domain-containing protein
MYRKVIDHPQYLPEAVRATADFDAGKDKGRIYRVVPGSAPKKNLAAARRPTLYKARAGQLCAALSSSNGWVRATAFRLLVEKGDKATAHLLRSIVKDSRVLPQARAASLHLLNILGSLNMPTLRTGLDDPAPGVREQAIQFAQGRLANPGELLEKLVQLAEDPDPQVRFQCALALGEATSPATITALARIAATDGADTWARAAVLSSVGNREDAFFQALLATPTPSPMAMSAVMTDLSRIFGLNQPLDKCLVLFNAITDPIRVSAATWPIAAAAAMAEGLRSRGLAKPGLSPLSSLASDDSAAARLAISRLHELSARALKLASAQDAPLDQRLSALAFFGAAGELDAASFLLKLLTPNQPAEIQAAAVHAYGQLNAPDLGKPLVTRERWRAYLPPVREAIVATLMSDSLYVPTLLDGLERGDIQPWSIDPWRRRQLMQHKDQSIKRRALALFKDPGGGDRQKVYQDYLPILKLPANAQNGHEVFKRVCTQCHTRAGEGVAVGPDLTGVQNQPPEALLLHILIPSYEIVPGYTSYDIETKDGRTLTGLIASETETSITLKRSLGATDTILRNNIASMSSAGLSLMPDELEKTLTRQELADLIAFLKTR